MILKLINYTGSLRSLKIKYDLSIEESNCGDE